MGTALFCFGVYQFSVPTLIAGFGVVAVGRLYEEHWYRKQTPLWRSVIEKFETACTASALTPDSTLPLN